MLSGDRKLLFVSPEDKTASTIDISGGKCFTQEGRIMKKNTKRGDSRLIDGPNNGPQALLRGNIGELEDFQKRQNRLDKCVESIAERLDPGCLHSIQATANACNRPIIVAAMSLCDGITYLIKSTSYL